MWAPELRKAVDRNQLRLRWPSVPALEFAGGSRGVDGRDRAADGAQPRQPIGRAGAIAAARAQSEGDRARSRRSRLTSAFLSRTSMRCPTRTGSRNSRHRISPLTWCGQGFCATGACSCAASSLIAQRLTSPSRSSVRSPSAVGTTPTGRSTIASICPSNTIPAAVSGCCASGLRPAVASSLSIPRDSASRWVSSTAPSGCPSSSRATSRRPRSSAPTRRRCAGQSRRSPVAGIKTASSWATSRQSICGCRCRPAVTTRRGSTSSRAV